jgi:hypothetical protein
MLTGQTVPPPIGNTFYGTVTQGGSSAAVGTTIHIAVDRQEYGTTQVVTDPGLGNIYSGNVNGPEGASVTFRSTDYEFAQEGTISTTTLQRLDITTSAYVDTQSAQVDQAVTFNGHGGATSLIIDPNGEDLGNTTLQVKANQDCATSRDTVQRCFEITPTNLPTGSGATLTFFFYPSQLNGNTCANLNAYHWHGSGWDTLTLDTTYANSGLDCTNKPHSLRVTDVTAFSTFVLKANSSPTPVRLTRLAAARLTPAPVVPAATGIGLLWAGILLARRWRRRAICP